MEKEKKTFVDWINEHKKELIIAGVSIATIIAVIIRTKNDKALEKAWEPIRKLVEKAPETMTKSVSVADVVPENEIGEVNIISAGRASHDVAGHFRNLPKGQKASAQKIATAAEHGCDLPPGKTLVEGYRTGGMTA